MITRVGNLERLKTKPFDNLTNCGKIPLLFSLRVSIVVTEIAFPAVIACKAEIDGDGFAVTDVEISIWLLIHESTLHVLSRG